MRVFIQVGEIGPDAFSRGDLQDLLMLRIIRSEPALSGIECNFESLFPFGIKGYILRDCIRAVHHRFSVFCKRPAQELVTRSNYIIGRRQIRLLVFLFLYSVFVIIAVIPLSAVQVKLDGVELRPLGVQGNVLSDRILAGQNRRAVLLYCPAQEFIAVPHHCITAGKIKAFSLFIGHAAAILLLVVIITPGCAVGA